MSEGVQTAVVSPTCQETQGRALDRGPASSAPVVEVEQPALSPEAPCRPGGRSPGQALGAVGRSWSLSPGRDAACEGAQRVLSSVLASSTRCQGAALPPPSPVGAPAISLCPPVTPSPTRVLPQRRGGTSGCHQKGRSPVPVCTLVCVCDQEPPAGGPWTPEAGLGAVLGRQSGPWGGPSGPESLEDSSPVLGEARPGPPRGAAVAPGLRLKPG